MYHSMKQKEMIEALQLIGEFGNNFPMLSIREINFYELAKFYQKEPKDIISMVVFLDCMKHMNEQSEKDINYFIDLGDVSKIKVKKNQLWWSFEVYKNSNEKIKLQHLYRHQF